MPLLFSLLTAACAHSAETLTVDALTLPAKPHAGDSIVFALKGYGFQDGGKSHIVATLYYSAQDRIYGQLITMPDTAIL